MTGETATATTVTETIDTSAMTAAELVAACDAFEQELRLKAIELKAFVNAGMARGLYPRGPSEVVKHAGNMSNFLIANIPEPVVAETVKAADYF